jgi:hypothetical protein
LVLRCSPSALHMLGNLVQHVCRPRYRLLVLLVLLAPKPD